MLLRPYKRRVASMEPARLLGPRQALPLKRRVARDPSATTKTRVVYVKECGP